MNLCIRDKMHVFSPSPTALLSIVALLLSTPTRVLRQQSSSKAGNTRHYCAMRLYLFGDCSIYVIKEESSYQKDYFPLPWSLEQTVPTRTLISG